MRPRFCWVDGRLLPIDEPAVPASDSAFCAGRGCYTTARMRAGHLRFGPQHARRLARDARRLGLGEVDPERVLRALEESGRACFGEEGEGIVRVQASQDANGRLHLTALPRSPGPENPQWTACTSSLIHEGPMPWSGAKVSNHLLTTLASDEARAAGVDEVLLLDREGYLVEGSRSNLVVVTHSGETTTPDPDRGGVTGVGLEILRQRGEKIQPRHVAGHDLERVSELIAVNAIRGPRPIVALDGRPVGDGRPGPVARRLADCFEPD